MAYRSMLLLLVLALAVAGCSSQDADTDVSQETTTTTMTAVPTTEVSATPQDLVLTFDGDQCVYAGPSVGDLTETLSFTLVNDSDVYALATAIWVPPDTLDEVMPTVGTDFPFSDRTRALGLRESFYVEGPGGSEQSLADMALPTPGTYVLDCITTDGANRLHVWRPVAIEFS